MITLSRHTVAVAGQAGLLAVLVLLGVVISIEPRVTTLVAVASVVLLVWGLARGWLFTWDLFAFTFGGLIILGYGFVNVGLVPGLPVSLADVVVVLLGGFALTTMTFTGPIRVSLFFWGVYLAIATMRLAVDAGVWGMDAVRDYSTAVEMVALPVGYWSMRQFGFGRWVRMVGVISLIALAYAFLYPFSKTLASVGPVVGLQQPIPLLGSYAGPGVLYGFFASMVLRPYGRWSIVAAALFLPCIAIQQSRGQFVAVLLVLFVILFASGRLAGRLRRAAVAVVAIGAGALALTFVVAPQGRLGPTSAHEIVSEIGTLTGAQGPGAGTYAVRKQWFSQTIERVREQPFGWAVGLGLGPDLADGFKPGTVLVRKPHDDYLEAYARLGVGGLLALVLLLASTIVRVFSSARGATGRTADFLWWVVAVGIAEAFIAATQPLLAYGYGTIPLLAVLGAGLSVAEVRQGEDRVNA